MESFTSSEIHGKVMGIFSQALGIDSQDLDFSVAFNSYPGWDSLKQLEIVSDLERAFRIDISIDDVVEMQTLKRVEEIVTMYLGSKTVNG